jgi:hypothetical protein
MHLNMCMCVRQARAQRWIPPRLTRVCGAQAQLIEERRLQALARRQAKAAEAAHGSLEQRTMGASWLRILQPEFSKPYYAQVRVLLMPASVRLCVAHVDDKGACV